MHKRNRKILCYTALSAMVGCWHSMPLLAKECFEISPAVDKSDDIYIDQKIPELTTKQHDDIKRILTASTGSWTGTMSVTECFGTQSSLTVNQENYEIKGKGQFDGNNFEFDFDLYSLTSKSRKSMTLKYSLTEEYFSVDARQTGITEVVTTTQSGVSSYKRFRQTQAGKAGSFVKEVYNVFEASGSEIAIKEYQYINGELIAESVMQLD